MRISGLFLIASIFMFLTFSDSAPLVKYGDRIYQVSEEIVDAASLERRIGQITEYAEKMEHADSDQASNYYPPGTRIYKVENIPVEEALAIAFEEQFIKAVYLDNLYTKEMLWYNYVLPATFLVILTIIYLLRERIKKKYHPSLLP